MELIEGQDFVDPRSNLILIHKARDNWTVIFRAKDNWTVIFRARDSWIVILKGRDRLNKRFNINCKMDVRN